MMSLADEATWITILGTWVLVVGTLAFAYWQLKQAQSLNSASNLLDMRERFYGDRMKAARRTLSAWLLDPNRSDDSDDWEVAIFFEMMGFLTRTRVLNRRMVWNAFGGWITAYYLAMTRPVDLIERWRREERDATIFREFEWMAKQMLALDRRLGGEGETEAISLDHARVTLGYESALRPGATGPGPGATA